MHKTYIILGNKSHRYCRTGKQIREFEIQKTVKVEQQIIVYISKAKVTKPNSEISSLRNFCLAGD